MGSGTFPGVKRPERGFNHVPPSSAEVKGTVELPSTSPLCLHGVLWVNLKYRPIPTHKQTTHTHTHTHMYIYIYAKSLH